MKNLSQIKDEVAKENGYKDWEDCKESKGYVHTSFVDAVAKKYMETAIKICAEVAFAYIDNKGNAVVSKGSILSLINELQ